MPLWLGILLIVVFFIAGVALGIYLSRRQFEQEIAQYPRLNKDALRVMMGQMGQKPSEARVNQVYQQIVNQQKKQAKK
ncbi:MULTISPECIES: YneF family protein [unclassified Streptococcus]|uniref:YneF family protein n=1 Tax=unclassified Streptococcus TaxID=2608887 RepID=UPI0018AC7B06|nr:MULTISPECIES: YneF family protein [unclassified Streptococcus]MBF8970092.1 YneF family protein [Streptococcus sp. NLN76]MBG9367789.1 YneF family protein [Streptococcus sp. NLN64]MBJ6746308.1 YneF family protein [Streptococcus sp. 121]